MESSKGIQNERFVLFPPIIVISFNLARQNLLPDNPSDDFSAKLRQQIVQPVPARKPPLV